MLINNKHIKFGFKFIYAELLLCFLYICKFFFSLMDFVFIVFYFRDEILETIYYRTGVHSTENTSI